MSTQPNELQTTGQVPATTLANDLENRKHWLADCAQRRDLILDNYHKGLALLVAGEQGMRELIEDEPLEIVQLYDEKSTSYKQGQRLDPDTIEDRLEQIRRQVDGQCWIHCAGELGFLALMDVTTRKKFEAQCESAPLPFSLENAISTFSEFSKNRMQYLREGLVTVLVALSSEFRSHEPFVLGTKIVVSFAFGYISNKVDSIADLYRACCVLIRGQEPEPRPQNPIYQGLLVNGESDVQCEFFFARRFKNGNVHITFRSQAVVDTLNREIAAHFGNSLPMDRRKK